MTLLNQPSPDAPVPPPSEAALLSQRKWSWLKGVGIGCILLLLLGLFVPMTIRSKKMPEQSEAVSNLRQLGLALFSFEQDYGRFPCADTVSEVRSRTSTVLDLGDKSSNELFRQLLATGDASSEGGFYARIAGVRRPDNVTSKGQALKKGECGFAYVTNLDASGNPARPIALTPLIPETDRFDPTRFNGKAIVLKVDNSVVSMNISKSGHVIVHGKNLLDPTHPVWAGKPPVIKWPE